MPVGMPPRAAILPLMLVDGRWDEARELAIITHAQGSPLERQMAATILGQLAFYQGDTETAWRMIRDLIPRGPDSEPEDALFPYATEALRLATRICLDIGEINDATAWLDTHDRWLEWAGAVRGQAESALLWAEVRLAQGENEEARRAGERARALASDPRQPLTLTSVYRILGQIALLDGEIDRARREIDASLSIAEACAAPLQTASAILALADLHHTAGRASEVQSLLDRVREIAEGLHAAPLCTDVQARLARLASSPNAPPPPSELTTRETDVLRLVAEGLTDAEVAEQLYISPRTVSQHLRSIYSKLGVSSRTQATRVAVQKQLV